MVKTLEGEVHAEDDLVRARHPQRVGSLKGELGNTEAIWASLKVIPEAHRANIVITPFLALPGAFGRRCVYA
jgi:hypothetical protein